MGGSCSCDTPKLYISDCPVRRIIKVLPTRLTSQVEVSLW